jgi:hypothetical protein
MTEFMCGFDSRPRHQKSLENIKFKPDLHSAQNRPKSLFAPLLPRFLNRRTKKTATEKSVTAQN